MKTSIKFSLIGGLVGAVLMFGVILLIEWRMNQYPLLDTQVIKYLESKGYPVDTVGDDFYKFVADGDQFFFDYYPNDPAYLRIFAGYDVSEFNRNEVEAACLELMTTTKNCSVFPEDGPNGVAVRINCESFVSDDDALDTDIIDRAIKLIQQVDRGLYRKLIHKDKD